MKRRTIYLKNQVKIQIDQETDSNKSSVTTPRLSPTCPISNKTFPIQINSQVTNLKGYPDPTYHLSSKNKDHKSHLLRYTTIEDNQKMRQLSSSWISMKLGPISKLCHRKGHPMQILAIVRTDLPSILTPNRRKKIQLIIIIILRKSQQGRSVEAKI